MQNFKLSAVLGNGGAVYISTTTAQFVFTNVIFENCQCTQNGGAIYGLLKNNFGQVTNCQFIGCKAQAGGAIFAITTKNTIGINIQQSKFENNTAVSTATITTKTSTTQPFANTGGGGAIFYSMWCGSVDSCDFVGNICKDGYGSNIVQYVISSAAGDPFKYVNCSFYFTDDSCKSSIYFDRKSGLTISLNFENCHFYNTFNENNEGTHIDSNSYADSIIWNENCFSDELHSNDLAYFSSNTNYQSGVTDVCPKFDFLSKESSVFSPSLDFTYSFEFSISNSFSRSEEFSKSNSFITRLPNIDETLPLPGSTDSVNTQNENGPKGKKGLPTFAYVIIAVGVLLTIGVVILIILVIKKRKQPDNYDKDDINDKNIATSGSKVSFESTFYKDENLEANSLSCV